MSGDFFTGFVLGFILATFIGWVLGQIQKTRRRVGAHNRKQAVLSFTEKTPQQVRADHFKAVFEITGWVFILVVGVSILICFLI